MQILSGVFLVFFYLPCVELAFAAVDFLSREVQGGVALRAVHLVGASLFFFFMILHLGRGLRAGSFTLRGPWWRGSRILMLRIVAAFLGYVLP